MKNVKSFIAAALIALVLAISCKKSDNASPNPGTPFMTTAYDTMSATINGSPWKVNTYSFGLYAVNNTGAMELTGTDSAGGRTLSVYINDLVMNTAKTYNITANGVDSSRYYNLGAPHTGTGTLEVVAITDSFIQGKFSITADAFTIANGVFNYKR